VSSHGRLPAFFATSAFFAESHIPEAVVPLLCVAAGMNLPCACQALLLSNPQAGALRDRNLTVYGQEMHQCRLQE
jgi:hypothetical protein